jgi:hypothetical protein
VTRRNAFNGLPRFRPVHKCRAYALGTPRRPSVQLQDALYARITVWAVNHGLTNKDALERILEGL